MRVSENCYLCGQQGYAYPHIGPLNCVLCRLQTELVGPVTNVVKGWLWKQGALFKRWSRRYYTLDKGLLLYYPDVDFDSSKPLDHLVMSELISAAADDGPTRGHGHAFTLTTVDRTLHLAAETPDELKEWLGAFTKYVQHNSLQKKIAQKRATRKY